jgi:hypothetical protein
LKALVLALVLAVPVAAQSKTTCIQLHYDNILACTYPDGGGSETHTDATGTTVERTEYDSAKWPARYLVLLKSESDYLDATAKIHAKYAAASAIHRRKDCVNAGFVWAVGACSPPAPISEVPK